MSTTKEGFSVFYENPEIFNFLQNHGLEGCILYDLDQPKDSWINPKALSVLGFEKQEGYRVISHLQHTIENLPEHVSEGLTRQGKLSLPTANHGEIQFSYVSLQIPQSGIILIALKEKLNASTTVRTPRSKHVTILMQNDKKNPTAAHFANIVHAPLHR